jgi:hypothetical protein
MPVIVGPASGSSLVHGRPASARLRQQLGAGSASARLGPTKLRLDCSVAAAEAVKALDREQYGRDPSLSDWAAAVKADEEDGEEEGAFGSSALPTPAHWSKGSPRSGALEEGVAGVSGLPSYV